MTAIYTHKDVALATWLAIHEMARQPPDAHSGSTRGDMDEAGLFAALSFYRVLDRYNNGLKTIISSEYTLDSLSQIDEAIGSRIREMAGNYWLCFSPDKAKNYRSSR